MENIEKINSIEELNSFVSESQGKVIVLKFGSEWCGPCRLMHDNMLFASKQTKDSAVFAEVDVDEAEKLSETYDIQNIPVTFFYKNNLDNLLEKRIGLITKEDFIEKIKEYSKK